MVRFSSTKRTKGKTVPFFNHLKMKDHYTPALFDFLNRATLSDLTGIEDVEHPAENYGIGETVARRILEYRSKLKNQQFESLAQIDAIPGIGKDKIEDLLKASASFSSPTSKKIQGGLLDLSQYTLAFDSDFPQYEGDVDKLAAEWDFLPGGA